METRGKSKHPLPAPSSLSSAPSTRPPILRATRRTNGSKEGERACKLCLHALSPACRVAPTCARPRHMCGGALFPPPSARRVRAPPLCANGVCRHPKGTHPPTFRHSLPLIGQNNERRTRRRSPFPPPLYKRGHCLHLNRARKAGTRHNPRPLRPAHARERST